MVVPLRLAVVPLVFVIPMFSGCMDDAPSPLAAEEEPAATDQVVRVRVVESETTSCLPHEKDGPQCLDSLIRVFLGCDPAQEVLLNATKNNLGGPTVIVGEAAPSSEDGPAPWIRCTYNITTRAEGRAILPESNFTFLFRENGNLSHGGCYIRSQLGRCGVGGGVTAGGFSFSGPDETVTLHVSVEGWLRHFRQSVATTDQELGVTTGHHEHLLTVTVGT